MAFPLGIFASREITLVRASTHTHIRMCTRVHVSHVLVALANKQFHRTRCVHFNCTPLGLRLPFCRFGVYFFFRIARVITNIARSYARMTKWDANVRKSMCVQDPPHSILFLFFCWWIFQFNFTITILFTVNHSYQWPAIFGRILRMSTAFMNTSDARKQWRVQVVSKTSPDFIASHDLHRQIEPINGRQLICILYGKNMLCQYNWYWSELVVYSVEV